MKKEKSEIILLGGIGEKKSNRGTQHYEQDRIYDSNGVATSLHTVSAFQPNYAIKKRGNMNNLRIRKLVPNECLKLMGFSKDNAESIKDFSDMARYHVAGDSIITTVLMALFGELTDIDYRKVIQEYIEKEVI